MVFDFIPHAQPAIFELYTLERSRSVWCPPRGALWCSRIFFALWLVGAGFAYAATVFTRSIGLRVVGILSQLVTGLPVLRVPLLARPLCVAVRTRCLAVDAGMSASSSLAAALSLSLFGAPFCAVVRVRCVAVFGLFVHLRLCGGIYSAKSVTVRIYFSSLVLYLDVLLEYINSPPHKPRSWIFYARNPDARSSAVKYCAFLNSSNISVILGSG